MKVTVLGSGTSTGVPVPGCSCEICSSSDPKNQRLRTSIFIELHGADQTEGTAVEDEVVGRILVDTSTDLRQQALRAGISRVDAVLYTHTHADHVNGIDDIRGFNFAARASIPVFGSAATCEQLKRSFSYVFQPNDGYEGGAPPKLTLNEIQAGEPQKLFGVPILPLQVFHGSMEVYGFRVGNFAYLTDCNQIPDETRSHLSGLEYLILDGLRERPHKTHFTFQEAAAEVVKLRPTQTYLTHITHEVDHNSGNARLKELTELPLELAYDGLELRL